MISHQWSCIFIHIPKTAGSSIEDVIWPNQQRRVPGQLWMGFIDSYRNKYQTGGLQHLFAVHVRQEVGEEIFRRCYKFSFVRNPWDKVISQFSYMKGRPDLQDYVGMRQDAPLAEYLERIARRKHVQWEEQVRFLLDETGELLVDFVGRFETLMADAHMVFDRLGLVGVDLPHTNRSERGPYQLYYDDECRQRVAEMYRADIERFGYSYEEAL
jgi:Sulfotransferase family